jgi:hypothetical protein
MGTGGSFLGVKRQGREAAHSSPTSAEVKQTWSIHPLPHTSSRHSAQLVKHKDNFTFYIKTESTLSLQALSRQLMSAPYYDAVSI